MKPNTTPPNKRNLIEEHTLGTYSVRIYDTEVEDVYLLEEWDGIALENFSFTMRGLRDVKEHTGRRLQEGFDNRYKEIRRRFWKHSII